MCRLLRALYSHPDSGSLWERYSDAQLRKIGFKDISPRWSVCFHDQLSVLLDVYVGDFKMARPAAAMPKPWDMIRSAIKAEALERYGLFLACMHDICETHDDGAGQVRKVTYKVEAYLKNIIEEYLGVLPPGPALRHAPHPIPDLVRSFGYLNSILRVWQGDARGAEGPSASPNSSWTESRVGRRAPARPVRP